VVVLVQSACTVGGNPGVEAVVSTAQDIDVPVLLSHEVVVVSGQGQVIMMHYYHVLHTTIRLDEK
jgi:hypothetical protein